MFSIVELGSDFRERILPESVGSLPGIPGWERYFHQIAPTLVERFLKTGSVDRNEPLPGVSTEGLT